MPNKRKIVAILTDLMFTVKIQEAAKRVGLEAIFAKNHQEAMDQAKQDPAVIILDLNASSIDSLDVIEKLKSNDDTNKISLLGFVSHLQVDLKQAAQKKGCDVVMARSAFSQ